MVLSRTSRGNVPPSGRQSRPRSGGDSPRTITVSSESVRSSQREHLGPLTLGQATPDPIRLVHLQRMRAARGHGRTLETDRFRLRLTPGPRRAPLALGMEEERARHPATGCVQLPVPKISIRAGKAPGVRHVDPLFVRFAGDLTSTGPISKRPTEPGIWARSVTQQDHPGGRRRRPSNPGDLPCWSRIRADPGAVDLQTLDRFSSGDKSLIMIFVDLDTRVLGGRGPVRSKIERVSRCGAAHSVRAARVRAARWPIVALRLLSAVGDPSIAQICPKGPLSGTYCRTAEGQGSSGPIVQQSSPSISSAAGGTT